MAWLAGLGLAKWLVGGLLAGLGLLIGVAIARSIDTFFRYGPRAFLRNSLRMENETWRLIGILLLLAAMAAAVWIGQTPLFS